ncbi:MAG TPA: hypothetical protein VF008_22345 [Niastella sp.]
MKQFIRKIFAFTVIPLACIVIGLILIAYISKTIDYKLGPGITEIYIGDSHIQCAINDSLLENSKNVSKAAESFYYSYYKLKKLIEKNQHIEKVYLGVGYHSLSNYFDKFINGEYVPSVSPKYFYLLPGEVQCKLVAWNRKNFPPFIKEVARIGYSYLIKEVTFSSSFGYSNNYTHEMASKPSMEKRLQYQFYTNGKLNDFSAINLIYLNKIINLCKTNKIDLVFLNAPIHPYYRSKIPANYIARFNEIANAYHVQVIDFSNLSLGDSCFIPNGDHVSEKGAYEVTNELIRLKQNIRNIGNNDQPHH